jgi:methyl-accepting chemotaxis protein
MPEEAYKDLWNTIKTGKPWIGLVKNRAKTGAFYWVKATATAIHEGGEITGYMSVRSRPSSEEVRAHDALYRRISAGTAKNIVIRGGKARPRPNAVQKFLGFFSASLRSRLLTVIGFLSVATLMIAAFGLIGLSKSSDRLRGVYEDRLVPITQLSEISDRMRQNITLVILSGNEGAKAKGGQSQIVASNVAQVQTNIDRITVLWQAYMATSMTAEGIQLSQDYKSHRGDFVKSGLKPALDLIRNGKFDEVNSQISDKVIPLFDRAKADNDKLIDLQKKIASEEYTKALSDYHANLGISLGAILVSLLLATIAYRSIVSSIVDPLKKLVECFGNIAQGRYDTIIEVDRDDEIGGALQDVNALQIKLGFELDEAAKLQTIREAEREARSREDEARRAEKEAEQEAQRLEQETRVRQLGELTGNFDTKITAVLKSVDTAASELNSSAKRMTAIANDTSLRTQTVAAASEQASTNVQTVAVAAEELSASISEIGRQVTHSSQISEQAVERANLTNETMRKLEGSAQKIGAVVNLISDIAGQTNLLALNATIEAARAGEAGKGFAVVASEVKGLANQTAKATEEISSQVLEMQTVTSEAVKAIDNIIATIRDVRDVATAIASAVEEQGAATQEIARNVQEAAKGTDDVNRNIGEVTSGAVETGTTATQVQSAADALGQQSEALRGEVDGFLIAVKAI